MVRVFIGGTGSFTIPEKIALVVELTDNERQALGGDLEDTLGRIRQVQKYAAHVFSLQYKSDEALAKANSAKARPAGGTVRGITSGISLRGKARGSHGRKKAGRV